MAERELAIVGRAKNFARVSSAVRGVSKDVDRLGKHSARAGMHIGQAAARLAALGGVAVIGGIAASLKVAGDFEAQLRTINTITRLNDRDLTDVGKSMRQIARDTGTTLTDLTTGYYDLVSAGIKAKDATNVLRAANDLAIGGLATTAESVDLLTTTINTYGGDATKAAEYADVFAKAIERGKVKASELAGSFAQVGPLAAAMGISVRELSAGYAQLTAAGVPAAEASTQMRAAMVALQRPTATLKKLQKDLNVDFAKMAREKGLVKAYQLMRTEADKAGIPLIKLTGRIEGTMFALQTTGPNFTAYNKNLREMGRAAGTARAQMEERAQGLNFQLGRMKALARDAGITIGTALLPTMTRLINKANKLLADPKVQRRIEQFGASLAANADKITARLEKVDWGGIARGLKMGGEGAKAIANAFMGLPPEIQAFLATGFVANKFSGGLLGAAVSELGKGLIKGVLGMNAAVVNIRAGTVVGGGGGGVPVGGKGGGLGAAAGILKVAVVGTVAVAAVEQLLPYIERNNELERKGLTLDERNAIILSQIPPELRSGRATVTEGNRTQAGYLKNLQAAEDKLGITAERHGAGAAAKAAQLLKEARDSKAYLNTIGRQSAITSVQAPAAAKEAGLRAAAASRLVAAGVLSVGAAVDRTTAAAHSAAEAIRAKKLAVNVNVRPTPVVVNFLNKVYLPGGALYVKQGGRIYS